MGLHGLLLRSMRGFIGVSSLFFISGQNLASRKIQRPGWGVKDIGAQLWALKMISGYILTVLILDFSLR